MFLVRRLIQIAVLLAALSAGLFYLLHVMPGSPEDQLLAANPRLAENDLERIRAVRSLDRPIHARYICWLVGRTAGLCDAWPSEQGILGGDLGWSSVHKLPVREVLGARLTRTLAVTIPAFLIALMMSTTLGALAAIRRGRLLDRAVNLGAFLGLSVPSHWLAMMAILVFAVLLGWLPASGAVDIGDEGLGSHVRHAILPVAILSTFYAARWTRYVRASMLEVLSADFVRTARAKGLTERRVVFGHALPNALFPLVTVVAQSIPGLFSGALIVERVFAYPGIGVLVFESVEANDHLVAIVVFMIYAALTMFAALLADALYFAIDPRIRREGASP
jgi:peptide/nickel transport system permease protein